MKNLGSMLKQAQDMQAKMGAMQDRLGDMTVTGEAAAGLVKITLTGKGDMKQVTIDPKLLGGEDRDMLEDLIIVAHQDAKSKMDALVEGETGKIMGGLKLPPGFKMPF
jgi:nucleoid-associated protein EbfC